MRAVVAGVAPLDAIAKVESPFEAGNEGQISADRHSAFVGLELTGDPDNAADIIEPVVDRVEQVQKANPDFYIGSFGTSTSLGQRLCPFVSKKARYFSRSSSVFINEIYRSIYAVGRAEDMIEVDLFTTFFCCGP